MTDVAQPERAWPRRKVGPSKADARYDQIYETAARLFYEKGYAATSLQDLANAVGLQKGSLYYYIDSKEDLLYGITDYAHTFFTDLVEQARDEGASPAEGLRRLLHRHAKFAAEHFHVTAAFYNERGALAPERQAVIVQTRDAYEASLRAYVKQGQEAGEFSAELDPKIAVFGILGMINWMYQWYRPGGGLTPQELADALSAQAVRSLMPERG